MSKSRAPFALVLALASLFSTAAPAEIYLHPDLPEDQRRAFEYDLGVLDRVVPIQDAETDASAAKFGLTEKVTAASLRAWLEARAHYVVPQEWDFTKHLRAGKKDQSYPNPGVFPTIEKPTHEATDGTGKPTEGAVTVAMANIGTALYYSGKLLSKRVTLEIDRRHSADVLSPRVGLFRVGQALFSELVEPNPATPNTTANAIMRLATFFHESRHSDGNGATLGFFHAVCPEGVQYGKYVGYSACDRNRNGPYTVGAEVLRILMRQCTDCSVADKEFLRAKLADSLSRVIPSTTTAPDTLAIASAQVAVSMCEVDKIMNKPERAGCPEARARLAAAQKPGPVETANIDDAPESISE